MDAYIHVPCGGEIRLMSVILKVTSEGRLSYGSRQLLYVEGLTTVGSACCGAVDCRVIYVPGLIASWHCKTDKTSGLPVSLVEPFTDPTSLEGVKKLLFETFPSSLFFFA
ncbi:MAG TPA: hypothetical protein P5238_02575 [Smithellaceae bacterium]|nr:hypothetical protein [Smithellaceae bacterium]HRV43991.1 hypothetical protein [Smithellaceae bacterium]